MKRSSMMAVVFCGVLALAVSGCKYDDDEALQGGEDVSLTDAVATETDAADQTATQGVETDQSQVQDADTTSLADATGNLPFDQDANYARCTDVAFPPVYFGFAASNLAQGEMAKIEAVAEHLKGRANRVVIVEGNCDERGSNEYNLSLGELRAIAVRDYLVQLGVDVARIQVKSYGEEKPAVDGHDESAWAKNRRGEFAVFQHK